MAKATGGSSTAMAVARIGVGIMFLFFAEYKLASTEFARQGYSKWVTGFVEETAVSFYKPFLQFTLHHAMFFAYAVAIIELLIGLSMVFGFRVRLFSILGVFFMIQLVLSTWNLPAGTPAWRYLGNELEHIPLLLMFIIFYAHSAGETLGLDGSRGSRPSAKRARA
ncbi:MAG TPA: DoxX family protein [Candidatus Angelobacter sp.]|nr:DoxX family protein [Candidatus Angelobacter sp.]